MSIMNDLSTGSSIIPLISIPIIRTTFFFSEKLLKIALFAWKNFLSKNDSNENSVHFTNILTRILKGDH